MNEILFIFIWWFTLFLGGLIFFPICSLIFKNFYDKGYIFSKTISIAFVSYSIFLAGNLKILTFTSINIYFITLFFLLINFFILRKYVSLKELKSIFSYFLIEEVIFILGFCFWVFVRSHEPSIHGLEKFMDFGFINSILRSNYLPPVDMWFPPDSINYYYFGHFITAVLTKTTNIPSYISYNLMVATLFSLTFSLSFSIGINLISKKNIKLIRNILGGILFGFLVTLSGNLHTIYSLFLNYNTDSPQPFWTQIFSASSFPNAYWYPNATRFIPFTIHEFPLYSFVVSDLHGHVLDIPFVLLTIAICYSVLLSKKINFLTLLLLSFLISIMYMTNAWDGLIYLLLIISVFALINLTRNNEALFNLKNFLLSLISIIAGFIAFSLPFNLNFKPFVSGIGIICAPQFLINIGKIGPFLFEADHCQRSAPWQLLILYGFFYFFVMAFLIFIWKKKQKLSQQDIFILLLTTLATLLIFIPEFLYAKDIYPAHYRANTMFKLVYQSFIMLSLSSAYILITILRFKKNFLFFSGSLILLAFVSIYSYFAIASYYGDFKNYKGLNGLSYLKDIYPTDYEAIFWLNKNIKGQPVIVEAQGDSYTDYERISVNTGLPTVLGWTVHEWLWRGSYNIPASRIEDVRQIYESTSVQQTQNILKKYHVSYIYVGTLERQKYLNISEEKFNKIGKIVYQNEDVRIFQVK